MNLSLRNLSDPSSITVTKNNNAAMNSELTLYQASYKMHVLPHVKPC